MADVCVIGGGPAGSLFAARMAQLGHAVTLVERSRFPRPHLGESLSPGVPALLDVIGARPVLAGFPRVRRVHVLWNSGPQLREDSREEAVIVDRGRFDNLLLDHARALGVRVLQPARAVERHYDERSSHPWTLHVATDAGSLQLRADFLADAGGRASASPHRRPMAPATLALYAYWQGSGLPAEPRIEAGPDAWTWLVPLPGGLCNILAFVDIARFRATRTGSLKEHFPALLRRSGLAEYLRDAQPVSPVQAIDATPYLHEDSVTPASIRIGEAALAIDPVSSSGVQKALQSALAAAVVANTLLCRPSDAEHAQAFYRSSLADASRRHAAWAAGHYASVAAQRPDPFWQLRAQGAPSAPAFAQPTRSDAETLAQIPVTLSPQLDFIDLPCIAGDFVTVKPALRHPALDGPIAFLAGHELAPLLRRLRPGSTPLELVRAWSSGPSGQVPLPTGLAMAAWLVNNGLLVPLDLPACGPVHELHTGVAEKPRP